jgi:hypothetical protein
MEVVHKSGLVHSIGVLVHELAVQTSVVQASVSSQSAGFSQPETPVTVKVMIELDVLMALISMPVEMTFPPW